MSDQEIAIFRKQLAAMTPQFARALPAHLPAERLARTIESAIMGNPYLLTCNRSSVWQACMTAATFGLEVDGRQSAIVPFRGKAQLIPMVAGLITLAANAGYVIHGATVRQKDGFDYALGDGAMIHHKPKFGGGRGSDNPVVASYATAWPVGHKEDRIFKVLDLEEIIAIRDGSAGYKSGKDSPWKSHFPQMAEKTAIRALANRLPWQVQKTAELEGRHDRGERTWATSDNDGSVTIEGEVLGDE